MHLINEIVFTKLDKSILQPGDIIYATSTCLQFFYVLNVTDIDNTKFSFIIINGPEDTILNRNIFDNYNI